MMKADSFARRYWSSLLGARPAQVSAPLPRAQAGVPLWQRYWASLTGRPLRRERNPPTGTEAIAWPTQEDARPGPHIEDLADALSSASGAAQRRARVAALIDAVETRGSGPHPHGLAARLSELLQPFTGAGNDRFLAHAVDCALARIHGDPSPQGLRLETRYAMAAAGDDRHLVRMTNGPVDLSVILDADGRLRVGATATLNEKEAEQIARLYGTMFLPFRVTDASGTQRVWMILRIQSNRAHGQLRLPEPVGAHTTVDLGGPPADSSEISGKPEGELARSLAAVTTRHDQARWEEVARGLPDGHALRRALDI